MTTKRNPMAKALQQKQFSGKVLPTKKAKLSKVRHKPNYVKEATKDFS